jgi:hypothetical protein
MAGSGVAGEAGAGVGGAAGFAGATAGAGGATGGIGGAQAGASGVAGSSGTRDGQPCSIAADCASGVCNPFYVDVDGDGYGAGQPVGFCGTAAPVGYASMNGDCCDNATNIAVAKLIHPGADFQTTSAGGVCGITWDYDCSGTVESNPQDVSCGSNYPQCTLTNLNFDESVCGGPDQMGCNCSGFGDGTNGSCERVCVGHPAFAIACK